MSKHFFLIFLSMFALMSCKPQNELENELIIERQSVKEGDHVNPSVTEFTILFSKAFKIENASGATLNGAPLKLIARNRTLGIEVALDPQTEYEFQLAKGTVASADGAINALLTIHFTTTENKEQGAVGMDPLCTPNPTPETQKLYDFLLSQYGNHILSGAMANVNWNINEAEWVHLHTGKYPALTCFDLIHLNESWINKEYKDFSIYEDWWNNNGIVVGMWHQFVPTEQGLNPSTYEPSKTKFSAANAVKEGTWENEFLIADLDRAAAILKGFQDRNIPVLWRPYHEAAGRWFWWGADAETYKALWHIMWERFVNFHGLHNLIWIWTTEGNDYTWFPGSKFVDIIGRDIYGQANASYFASEFRTIQSSYPHKMVTLSECGKNGKSLAPLSEQWNAGAKWSWFMPWYDYTISKSTSSSNFTDTDKALNHEHMPADYWRDLFQKKYVLSRDQVPSLK